MMDDNNWHTMAMLPTQHDNLWSTTNCHPHTLWRMRGGRWSKKTIVLKDMHSTMTTMITILRELCYCLFGGDIVAFGLQSSTGESAQGRLPSLSLLLLAWCPCSKDRKRIKTDGTATQCVVVEVYTTTIYYLQNGEHISLHKKSDTVFTQISIVQQFQLQLWTNSNSEDLSIHITHAT